MTSQLDFLHILLTSSSFLSLVMGLSLFPFTNQYRFPSLRSKTPKPPWCCSWFSSQYVRCSRPAALLVALMYCAPETLKIIGRTSNQESKFLLIFTRRPSGWCAPYSFGSLFRLLSSVSCGYFNMRTHVFLYPSSHVKKQIQYNNF